MILALSVLGVFLADAAKAGPSMAPRELSASADPATFSEAATRETESQIRLDKRKRRDVQRGLTRIGFDTRVNGRFDKSTRAVIARWQEARGYPGTGFLNPLQHQALLTESVTTAQASGSDKAEDERPARRRGSARHHRRNAGPVGVIGGVVGGVVGGLFGRR